MSIYVEPVKASIDGKSYFAELGTVTEAWLGREDHGIYTYVLTFDFGGGGQSAGNYNLNDSEQMGKHLMAIMDFFGCPFNFIKGKRAYVLREAYSGTVVGLLSEREDKFILFKDVANG